MARRAPPVFSIQARDTSRQQPYLINGFELDDLRRTAAMALSSGGQGGLLPHFKVVSGARTIGPPADMEYAVEPDGVAMMSPSDCAQGRSTTPVSTPAGALPASTLMPDMCAKGSHTPAACLGACHVRKVRQG